MVSKRGGDEDDVQVGRGEVCEETLPRRARLGLCHTTRRARQPRPRACNARGTHLLFHGGVDGVCDHVDLLPCQAASEVPGRARRDSRGGGQHSVELGGAC